jgi:Dolichyl-phosphate-mannose-protein mannosyltransferase
LADKSYGQLVIHLGSLPVGLPLAAYLLLFLAIENEGIREAAIHTAVIWGLATAVIAECLSLFHLLAAPGIACAWAAVALAAAGVLLWRYRASSHHPRRLAYLRKRLDVLYKMEVVQLAGILILFSAVGLTALWAPPNTIDAMTYHLPRVVHWLENRSVAFYATHTIRQLHMQPWAEYAILQFHALAGGDRFDNLVQWFSFSGSVLGVSLIARLLGAGMRGQVLAAVCGATIPQGLLEASGSMNDCVVAFWLVVLVYYLLRFREETSSKLACGAGAALGLACLTKTTALVIVPPILAIILLAAAPRSRAAWLRALACGIIPLVLNAPHAIRNYRLFHSPLGPIQIPGDPDKYTNDQFGPGPLLSNILRNVSLHIGTPLASVNHAIHGAIARLLAAAGQNLNDSRTTWGPFAFRISKTSLNETIAGNPLHVVIIVLVFAALIWRWKDVDLRPAMLLALGVTGSFLLFCAVLRWQPFHSRLHLPLFMVGSSILGAALERAPARRLTTALALLLLLSAIPYVAMNKLRPLVGANAGANRSIFTVPREDQYFVDLNDPVVSFRAAARLTESCPEVGLDWVDSPEYPIYVLLRASRSELPIRNAFITNASRIYDPAPDRIPVCLICQSCSRISGWADLNRRFRSVRNFGGLAVLRDPVRTPANGGELKSLRGIRLR